MLGLRSIGKHSRIFENIILSVKLVNLIIEPVYLLFLGLITWEGVTSFVRETIKAGDGTFAAYRFRITIKPSPCITVKTF